MKYRSSKAGTLAKVGVEAIRKFAASLTGEVIVPGDRQYAKARRVWNHAVNRRPAVIARCVDEKDVVRSVAFARRNDLLTAVRAGGHSRRRARL